MGLNLKHPPFLLMFSTNRGQTWWIVVAPCLESCLLDISRATWTISNPFPERWLHLGEVDNWSPLPEVEFKMYMFTIVYIIYINILYIKKYVIYIYIYELKYIQIYLMDIIKLIVLFICSACLYLPLPFCHFYHCLYMLIHAYTCTISSVSSTIRSSGILASQSLRTCWTSRRRRC